MTEEKPKQLTDKEKEAIIVAALAKDQFDPMFVPLFVPLIMPSLGGFDDIGSKILSVQEMPPCAQIHYISKKTLETNEEIDYDYEIEQIKKEQNKEQEMMKEMIAPISKPAGYAELSKKFLTISPISEAVSKPYPISNFDRNRMKELDFD